MRVGAEWRPDAAAEAAAAEAVAAADGPVVESAVRALWVVVDGQLWWQDRERGVQPFLTSVVRRALRSGCEDERRRN